MNNMRRLLAGRTMMVIFAGGLLLAWGILIHKAAGRTETPSVPLSAVVTAAPTKALSSAPPVPEDSLDRTLIRRGETFVGALARLGFSAPDAHRVALAIQPVYAIRRVHPGHEIRVRYREKLPLRLEYEVDPASRVQVSWPGNGEITATLRTDPYVTRLTLVQGTITTSLFAGVLDAGEDAALADLLASLFEYDIDFNRDIREGDSFRMLVEKRFLRGDFAGYGEVHAAEVVNREREIRIVRFTDSGKRTAYYHPDGRSVRKMFLRCPLPFMRITSRYGRRRHPVLGFSARHNGVDMAASVGTPIKATASGVVTHAGYHRSKGRYVQLRHPNGYATHYYHLSRFGRGIRAGIQVKQGQLIGTVGNTGLSTGPHLHYGIVRHGRFINPLSLKSPSNQPVAAADIPAFRAHCRRSLFSLAAFAWVQRRLLSPPMHAVTAPLSGSPVTSPVLTETMGGESSLDLRVHP